MQALVLLEQRCLSVCPSVRHTLVLHQNERSWRHDFSAREEPEIHFFFKFPVHPEILKGSPRARAISEVGTN